MEPPADPSAIPAHRIWVQLATRITTQRLHYRSGDEEAAAKSVASLFDYVRRLMATHREAHEFHRVGLRLLNETLRPYTARWHGWVTAEEGVERFRDEWIRRKVREELRELQPRLLGYQKTFEAMSRGEAPDPRWLDPVGHPEVQLQLEQECQAAAGRASLGEPVPSLLRHQVRLCAAGPTGRTEQDIAAKISAAEGAGILWRRKALDPSTAPDGLPLTNVSGLALSGGGIRSATFCLGIVQALQRHGLFERFDYLSTVSGGGYLGAFLSCYLGGDPDRLDEVEVAVAQDRRESPRTGTSRRSSGEEPERELASLTEAQIQEARAAARARLDSTFRTPEDGGSESRAIRHLRNNSRYLLNGGTWGLWRIAGVVLSGFATSLVMLLTLPLVAAWFLHLVNRPDFTSAFEEYLFFQRTHPIGIALLGLVLWAGGIFLCRRFPPGGPPLKPAKPTSVPGRIAMRIASWTGIALLGMAFVVTILMCGTWITSLTERGYWMRRDNPAEIAFAGCIPLLAVLWIVLPLAQRLAHGTKWDSAASRGLSLVEYAALVISAVATGLAAVWLAPLVVALYESARENLGEFVQRIIHGKPPELLTTALASIVPAIFGALMKRRDGTVRVWAQWLFFLTSPAFFLFGFLVFASNLGIGRPGAWDLRWAGAITLAALLWAWLFLNINTFAPHQYYRNRLCECYLAMNGRQQRTWFRRVLDRFLHGVTNEGPTDRVDGVGTLRRLPLSALGANAAAPYHLINATLNASASKSSELRGRDGDFFVFSRHYCGSPLTGYVTTEDLEKVDPHVDLGTAAAISGAAASTNMGWKTLRQLRFLMTLFNVRLGYWMRRPGSAARPKILEGPGLPYFFRELIGAVHEKSTYVNLSDGGHIENLAAYELLRRQCKFIVCVDAGMEPGMHCADLMRLQRYAAIDLGIRMHFDVTDLTLLPTSYSRAYAVLVKIDYAPEQAAGRYGWMLYLKLAMTGTEPPYVLDYRRENPAFPHQTTGDQLYDEAQFEAYRVLGECAVDSLFRREILQAHPVNDMEGWFSALAASLLPDNDPAFT